MQSNVTGIVDDLNQFPDSWVELYNNGSEEENLGDYAIGLKKKIDKAYALPNLTVASGDYVIIYCDKEEQGLHTSFRLESNKEGEVYLFKNGEQIQLVEHPAFPAPDIAFGYDAVTDEWGYELIPTPGEANRGGICSKSRILGSPVFSEKGGIKNSEISLSLTIPEGMPAGTEIRYTLDGSYPTKKSTLLSNYETIKINSSTIVRARLFCDGWLSPLAITQSYLYPDHEIKMPYISLTLENDHLYGADFGIYANKREEWRRPMNVEFFETSESESVINQVGECKISGNWSRTLPLKSMALYANKRFGEKRLEHEFFPDMRPGVTDFKSLMLRNAGNDFYECYMRDAVIQENVGNNMGLDYQAVRSCVIFINGEYKGIIHLRERSNEDNVYTHYDGLEEIDMVENFTELKEGSMASFDKFKQFYMKAGHTAAEYRELLDEEEYMDLHLANFYYNNCDFPGNNLVIWRPQAEGGRWRAIMKDTDYGMGLKYGLAAGDPYTFETITWVHDPTFPGSNTWGNVASRTMLFRNIENLPGIREDYITRALVYMGDFLNGRETLNTIEKRYAAIAVEWQYHAKLYKGLEGISETSLDENVEYMKEWVKGRDKFFPYHFADFYNIGDLAELQILQSEELNNFVNFEVNDYKLKTGIFTGYYPVGRELKISAKTIDERVPIIGWKVEYLDKGEESGEMQTYFVGIEAPTDEASLNFAFPEGYNKIVLSPVLNVDSITDDLSVMVFCENTDNPLEGVKVTVTNQTTGNTQSAMTNENGLATFGNLVLGNYKYELSGLESFLVNPMESQVFSFSSSMAMEVILSEKVLKPVNIIVSCVHYDENTTNVSIIWEMEGHGYNPEFLNYSYNVFVNDKDMGTTNQTRYSVQLQKNLNFEVKVVGTTPFGNKTEPVSIFVEVEKTTGINDVYNQDTREDEYYDLHGVMIKSSNIKKGIYFRKRSDGSFEKVFIR